MPAHDQRRRTVVHHEWTLAQPAHHEDMVKAMNAAYQAHHRDDSATSDVTVSAEDELLVLGYTAEHDMPAVDLKAIDARHADELGKLREAHDVHRKRLADALAVGWDRNWDQLIESTAGIIGAVVIQRDKAEADLADARAEILRFRIANGDAPEVPNA